MPKHGEILTGTITCTREACKKPFEWKYQYIEKGNTDVFVMPKNEKDEASVNNYDEIAKKAKVYCPHEGCGQPIFFDLEL